jgi:hypothetical protein
LGHFQKEGNVIIIGKNSMPLEIVIEENAVELS